MGSRLCCKDLCSNVPKDQHSLEEHSWHHASTTSEVAPVRFGKTGMAFSDKQNYRCMVVGGDLRSMPLAMTCQLIIKAQDKASPIFQQKAGSPWKTDNRWLPKTWQLHSFALHLLCSGSFLTMVAVQEL